MSAHTWRRAALTAYILAGLTLPLAAYTYATTAANMQAVSAQQSRMSDAEWETALKEANTITASTAAGAELSLDTRPYEPADWSLIVPQVMPSVVIVSVLPKARGHGETNKVWLVSGVQTNLATDLLNRYRAWQYGWAKADQERDWRPQGAGFIVGDGSTVLTAAHVLNGAEEVKVRTAAGNWRAARIIGTDRAHDVAVLLIAGDPGQPVAIAPALPRQGQAIGTVGMPDGRPFTLSTGIVSQYGEDGTMLKSASFMLVDAPIVSGNSGGVVINAKGEAVGMVSYGSEAFHQAVPIGRVIAVADALRRGRHYE